LILIVRSSVRAAEVMISHATPYSVPVSPPESHTVTEVLVSVCADESTVNGEAVTGVTVMVWLDMVSPDANQSLDPLPLVEAAQSNL